MCEQRFNVVLSYLDDIRDADDLDDITQISRLWTFSTMQRRQWEKKRDELAKRFKRPEVRREIQTVMNFN